MDIREIQPPARPSMDPAMIPAAPPPPGITPNFGHEEPMRYVLFVTIGICTVVSTVVLIMRLISRFLVSRIADWSDYAAVLGYAFSVAFSGLALKINETRRSRHMWHMSMLDYYQTKEAENLASIMYCFGMMFLKFSILFFFLKIFLPARRGVIYWSNIFLGWINALFYLGCIGGLIFQCVPREKISEPTLEGRCTDLYLIFLVSASYNVVSDFFILVFPIWAIWRLQMPVTRKLYSSVIFATGAFALLSSVLRLHSTTQIPHRGDVSWIIVKVAMWTAAEMTTVLLCCCSPSLPKLFRSSNQQRPSQPFQATLTGLHDYQHSTPEPKQSLEQVSEVEYAGFNGSMDKMLPPLPRLPRLSIWERPERDSCVYAPV